MICTIKHFGGVDAILTAHPLFWVCFVINSITPISAAFGSINRSRAMGVSNSIFSRQKGLFNRKKAKLCMVSNPSWRYPVGYHPDRRTRPQYKSAPIEDDSFNPMLEPKPRWEPPVGYDPKNRDENQKKSRYVDLRSGSTPRTDQVLETIDFENFDQVDNRLKLCTGIWLGNKILEKKCVWLDR